jgi:hypothetical protein
MEEEIVIDPPVVVEGLPPVAEVIYTPEEVYPCGHTARQVEALKLGCTKGTPGGGANGPGEPPQCRPEDERISREYFAQRT